MRRDDNASCFAALCFAGAASVTEFDVRRQHVRSSGRFATMDISVETIVAQLGFDQRYGPPPQVLFAQHGGSYGRTHKLDRVLGREVELCTEYKHVVRNDPSSRQEFIQEAKIGGLCHPNLVPVYDFGMTSDGLFYFTRPFISGMDLDRFIKRCLTLDGWRVFCESVNTSSLSRPAAEFLEGRRQCVSAEMQRLEEQGFVQWTPRPAPLKRQFSVPADADGPYLSVEKALADCERRIADRSIAARRSGSLSVEEEQSLEEDNATFRRDKIDQILRQRSEAFHFMVEATLRHNDVSIEQLATSERVVQLRLSRFVEVVLAACRGVAHAHRHGIWHTQLCPYAILVETAGGDIYVTDWGRAHCQGTAARKPWVGLPRAVDATWWCQPPGEENPGPAFDVYALGGVLSFILHESSPELDRGNKMSSRFREAIMAATEPARSDTREFVQDLEQVCLQALCVDPEQRYPQVKDFAAGLTGCIERARRNGMAS